MRSTTQCRDVDVDDGAEEELIGMESMNGQVVEEEEDEVSHERGGDADDDGIHNHHHQYYQLLPSPKRAKVEMEMEMEMGKERCTSDSACKCDDENGGTSMHNKGILCTTSPYCTQVDLYNHHHKKNQNGVDTAGSRCEQQQQNSYPAPSNTINGGIPHYSPRQDSVFLKIMGIEVPSTIPSKPNHSQVVAGSRYGCDGGGELSLSLSLPGGVEHQIQMGGSYNSTITNGTAGERRMCSDALSSYYYYHSNSSRSIKDLSSTSSSSVSSSPCTVNLDLSIALCGT